MHLYDVDYGDKYFKELYKSAMSQGGKVVKDDA